MPTGQPAAQPPRWGEPQPGPMTRIADRLRSIVGNPPRTPAQSLPELPLALRRGELAAPYLEADEVADHRRAGAAATRAMEAAVAAGEWWPADIWAHRALWHFEQAEMELAATRAARLIGEVRVAGGDPASARRYYAEAISEARDIGAEREEGLAALGLGRAHLQIGDVTTARRLAQIAIDLLERSGAPSEEVAAARELRGEEKEAR
jgi:tetratricopeptide (TPR) repeat protein